MKEKIWIRYILGTDLKEKANTTDNDNNKMLIKTKFKWNIC